MTLPTEIAGKLTGDSTPFAARLLHVSEPDEAEGLEDDRALFVRLYREGALDEAHAHCSERAAALGSDDCEGRVVWACNEAILRRDAEDHTAALALLNIVFPFLAHASTLTKAKYHNGLGRTFELLGRSGEAVAEYERAVPLYRRGGRACDPAIPLMNIGRVKASTGEVDEAGEYLHCAAWIALASGDFRLLGEIAEEGAKL